MNIKSYQLGDHLIVITSKVSIEGANRYHVKRYYRRRKVDETSVDEFDKADSLYKADVDLVEMLYTESSVF